MRHRRRQPSRAPLKRGSLIGSLQIPRLKLTAMVVEGDDDKTLKTGIGHLPDTPLPWEKGNAALAGHRDTFLRAMRDISAGDEIRLTTPHGDFAYRVREIAIVTPDNLAGLSKTDDSSLTLITCYPFSFVGNAPKRFVVRAWPRRTPRHTPASDESSVRVSRTVAAAGSQLRRRYCQIPVGEADLDAVLLQRGLHLLQPLGRRRRQRIWHAPMSTPDRSDRGRRPSA